MRLLAHGASMAEPSRLRAAVLGLAERGHEVSWLGAGAPPGTGVLPIASVRDLRGRPVDAVVGACDPWRAARLGWRAGARAMLLDVAAGRLQRWTLLDRWAWDSLAAMALVDEREADAVRGAARDLPLERFALWSADEAPVEADTTHADTEVLERAGERALARSAGRMPRAAAFVDRDGTLVVERGYLADPADLELLEGVPGALRQLRAAGFPVVVISNQSGVGRGLFPLSRVYEAMARLRRLLRAHDVELDGIYFCPHRPDAGCACRKPGTELLRRAADDLQLSLAGSMMVGDKRLDAATGQAAGATGVLVRTGYGRDEEARVGDGEFAAPDLVCDGLPAAAAWFIAAHEA